MATQNNRRRFNTSEELIDSVAQSTPLRVRSGQNSAARTDSNSTERNRESVYHNMDDRSWATDSSNSSALAVPINQESSLDILNSIAATNDRLSREMVTKSEEIIHLKAKVEKLEQENALLQHRLSEKPKSAKQAVNLDLSRNMKIIYGQLPQGQQFDTALKYDTPTNIEVKVNLLGLLKEDSNYSEKEYLAAIHSRYTHERKKATEDKENAHKRKVVSRRRSTYLRRLRSALSQKQNVDEIRAMTAEDMSDYETDNDDNWRVKRPHWRSDPQTNILKQLDGHKNCGKLKVIGSPSARKQRGAVY